MTNGKEAVDLFFPPGSLDKAFYRDDIAFVIESPPKNRRPHPHLSG